MMGQTDGTGPSPMGLNVGDLPMGLSAEWPRNWAELPNSDGTYRWDSQCPITIPPL